MVHVRLRPAARAALLAGVIFMATAFEAVSAYGQSFDKPLHKTVLDMGLAQNLLPYSKQRVTMTCWFYPHFMIKEQDDPGMKGAVLIALTPMHRGHTPRCRKTSQPGEKPFQEWSAEIKAFVTPYGYFAGAKRNMVFLGGSDGDSNSGNPLAVFRADGMTKVFEDSMKPGRHHHWTPLIRFHSGPGKQLTMHYVRLTNASCSIPKSGEACWSKLKQQTGLTQSPMPKCSDYPGKEAGTADSVIAYPVEVSLFPKPLIRPLGGPTECYPSE